MVKSYREWITWPGLTTIAVQKHLGKSIATSKGRMQQQRKNVQSTKIKVEVEVDTSITTGECYFVTIPLALTGKTFLTR